MTHIKSDIHAATIADSATASLPMAIYILAFGIFTMVTSEFQVSGMINVMATDLEVSISRIGYLVAYYAFAMAFGGPILTMLLLRSPPKKSLMILFVIFIAGESLGALAQSYHALVFARLITGAVSGAFFGTALAICVQIVSESQRAWATSIVLAGIMVGTVIGLPMANLIGVHLGWRESFWATAGLATIAGTISLFSIPHLAKQHAISLRGELSALRSSKLWMVFSTSFLIIGATFAAFTYFTPILKSLTGYSDAAVAILLLVYGIATIIGNTIVGKLADRHTLAVLLVGLLLLTTFLVLFALLASNKVGAATALIGVGLVGVTMNPAMVTRVMRTANGRPLVNTVHTSVITLGTMTGSFLGGVFISAGFGLSAPLWVGIGMACLGVLSLLPELKTSC